MQVRSTAHLRRYARLLRIVAPLGIAGVCLVVLADRMQALDLETLWRSAAQVSPLQWIGALVATTVSLWAVGRYDSVAHRHMNTGVGDHAARRSGVCAIAFSQTVGFGVLTGAFARWRMLPGLPPIKAVQLTGFVALSFLSALAILISVTFAFYPPAPGLRWIGFVAILALPLVLTAAFFLQEIRWRALSFRLPSIPALTAISGWTVLDTVAAASALYVLLPAGLELNWTAVFAAYLLALAAALLSGTPGGVGPFELTLMAMLPQADPMQLMAGVVAFRMVYFAVPACLAGAALLWPRKGEAFTPPAPKQILHPLPMDRPRAETGIIRQNGGYVLRGTCDMAVLKTRQILAALFDPVCGARRADLEHLRKDAKRRNLSPCLYKCSGSAAANARAMGWKVLRISSEAVLDPLSFTTEGRDRRQLRRKLRQAEKAELYVTRGFAPLPLRRMKRNDQEWQARQGGARGATIGRFDVDYVRDQHVFLAWRGDQLVGFASFHGSNQEWCLDLMRSSDKAPDGTMHALVSAALADAKQAGIPRLSLAAVLDDRFQRTPCGLRQFKASFAPRWRPLYMAAPSWPALALAAAELARVVHFPPVLPTASMHTAHDLDEENEFAPITLS